MGFEVIPGTSITYGLISFDEEGRERLDGSSLMSARLLEQAASSPVTHIFFFCHGWKGDIPAARDQYHRWIGAFMSSPDRRRAAAMTPGFSPMLIGLHWPSQPWGDEELAGGAFADGPGL